MDARPLLIAAAALALLLGIVVLALARQLSRPMRGLRLWAGAAAALSAGAAINALRGSVDPWVFVIAGNSFVFAARTMQVAALLRFDGRPSRDGAFGALVAGHLVVSSLCYFAWPSVAARGLSFVVPIAVMQAIAMRSVGSYPGRTVGRLLMSACLGIGVAVNAGQGLYLLLHPPPELFSRLDQPSLAPYVGAMLILEVVTSVAFVLLITDRMHEWVVSLSMNDHLTGALSRRAWFELAERDIRRARRTGTPACVLMLDVDDFKAINDTHGHPGGDAVLRRIAHEGRQILRGSDAFGRLGGDEFVVFLPDTGLASALAIAERFRCLMLVDSVVDGVAVPPFTVSIGVAAMPAGDSTPEALIALADRALYLAKRDGRNAARAAG